MGKLFHGYNRKLKNSNNVIMIDIAYYEGKF